MFVILFYPEGDFLMIKLLIFSQYYSPDFASTGQLVTDLAEGLSKKIDVTVIASMPNYSSQGSLRAAKEEVLNGVHVFRFPTRKVNKKSKISRIFSLLTYYLGAKKIAKSIHSNFDAVFCLSQPQILGGKLGCWAKKRFHSKMIYNIQDFCPESIRAIGMSHNELLLDLLLRMDNKSCKKSDLVVTVGRDLVETLLNRFPNRKPPAHVLINNWIDESVVYPLDLTDRQLLSFKERNGLNDRFVFMYSGNIGLFYDLPNLLEALSQFPRGLVASTNKKVLFVFAGEGGTLLKLKQITLEKRMDNVAFLPYQTKDQLIFA